MNWKNAKWNGSGGIDLEVEHPEHGWLPYTALDQSGEVQMQEIYDAALASDPAPYDQPAPTGADVNEERERRIMVGATFDITGHGPIRLQGDPGTIQNLDSLALKANLMIAQGQGSAVTSYRDADNIVHDITQSQVLEMWSKAGAYIEGCYSASWTLKDNPPIPVDYADDIHWP